MLARLAFWFRSLLAATPLTDDMASWRRMRSDSKALTWRRWERRWVELTE